MKYIDAEKLIAEIEREIEVSFKSIKPDNLDKESTFCRGEVSALYTIKSFITYLQQEQPEVELEKELDDFISEFYRHYTEYEGLYIKEKDWRDSIKMTARHFYELGRKSK